MMQTLSRTKEVFNNENLNKIAILGALCIFLSAIEYMFPKPLPFLRLGLANMPILLALRVLNFKSYLLLVLIKLLGQALVNGTLASYIFLFSAGSSFSSAIVMYIVFRLFNKHISFVGLSIMGALAGNIVQIVLSITIVFGSAAWKILPSFLGIGLLSGFFIGLIAEIFSEKSLWWTTFSGEKKTAPSIEWQENEKYFNKDILKNKKRRMKKKRKTYLVTIIHPAARFWSGLLIVPACLLEDQFSAKLVLLVLFIFLCLLFGQRFKIVYFSILIFSIVFFNILSPVGRVLFEIGSFKLTLGALENGLIKAFTLCSLILISRFSVSDKLRLPGKIGGLLSRSFYFLEQLLNMKVKISSKRIIKDIDNILISVFPADKLNLLFEKSENKDNQYKKYFSAIYALTLVGSVWLIYLLNL